jgi:hypothetical protein
MNLASSNPNKFRVSFEGNWAFFATYELAKEYIKKLKNKNRYAVLKEECTNYSTGITTFKMGN